MVKRPSGGRKAPDSRPQGKASRAFDIVALAASAGGVQALSRVVGALGEDFPAPVLIVQHVDRRHKSLLAEILQRRTPLRVNEAVEGDRIVRGHIYVAPPDKHMMVGADGTLTLATSELVNFVRPSADLMLESVAAHFKDRAIAVVLTGSGSDGAAGIEAIKQMGGTTIAQDQASSEVFGMPGAAVNTGCVDFVLPLEEIGPALETLLLKQD